MSKDNKAKNQTRKFFIYARKSTDSEDRQVRSIADQIAELKELANKENLEIVDIIVEKQTAKKPGRPMFADMLKRMEAGEATGILAWHPDRLARNSVDGGQIIYLVDIGVIKELKFPTFWLIPLLKENLCFQSLLGSQNIMLIIFRKISKEDIAKS